MKRVALLSFLFATSLLSYAQEPIEQSKDGRWGFGVEMAIPVYKLLSVDPEYVRSLELVGTHRYRENRAWRIGYRFQKYDHNSPPSRAIEGAFLVERSFSEKIRWHMGSIGHQWYFGTGCIQPFIGADATLGLFNSGSRGTRAEYESTGNGWNTSPSTNTEERYKDGLLLLGAAGALGFELKLHRHVMLQTRLSLGILRSIRVGEQLVPDGKPEASGEPFRINGTPFIGSGVYLMFVL